MEIKEEIEQVAHKIVVCYDGTVFSEKTCGSLDAAKEEAKKYESSAKAIVEQRAFKVLKPYTIPDIPKLEDQTDEVKKHAAEKNWIHRLYTKPTDVIIDCIANNLYTGGWSCLSDSCDNVYVFKPKSQEDIDNVTQYLSLIGAPIHSYRYCEEDYGTMAHLLNNYKTEAVEITIGKTYVVFVVTDNDCSTVVDVHEWLSKISAFVDDVDVRY